MSIATITTFGFGSYGTVNSTIVLGYLNAPVPPSNSRIILGLSMVAVGLTVLYGITTQLDRGLVEDDLNVIPKT